MAPTQYSFNPLQSQREVNVGDYYFKRGSYRAAAGRYREATKWNEKNAEAGCAWAKPPKKPKTKTPPAKPTRSIWRSLRTPRTPPRSEKDWTS